jgi:hypothetical protein
MFFISQLKGRYPLFHIIFFNYKESYESKKAQKGEIKLLEFMTVFNKL